MSGIANELNRVIENWRVVFIVVNNRLGKKTELINYACTHSFVASHDEASSCVAL